MPPAIASGIFAGSITGKSNLSNTSWKEIVSSIEKEAIIEVSEAPILASPITYVSATANGNSENSNKIDKLDTVRS